MPKDTKLNKHVETPLPGKPMPATRSVKVNQSFTYKGK